MKLEEKIEIFNTQAESVRNRNSHFFDKFLDDDVNRKFDIKSYYLIDSNDGRVTLSIINSTILPATIVDELNNLFTEYFRHP